jgi:hypothetical protein
VSDEELRALERAATEANDAASWLRVAQAASRAGKGDEAGHAVTRIRSLGGDAYPVLDALAPTSLEAFSVRELGKRFELEKLWFTAWSPDARTIYALENKKSVLAIDATTGNRRTVLVLLGEATAFAADAAGGRLALGLVTPEKRKLVNGVGVADVAAGKLESVGRGHAWIQQVAIAGETILCSEKARLRGYRYATEKEKSSLSLKGTSAIDATGAFAITLGHELRLHSAGSATPRATVHLDVPAEAFPRFHLACAGERTVLLAEDLVLLDEKGNLRARAKLPGAGSVYGIEPSPSGRHVAVFWTEGGQRTTRFDLLDVTTGASRTFDLAGRPRWASWSPSGQRLAIPTDQGTIALVEAAAAPTEEPKPVADDGWVELRSPQRFWRARQLGALIEFHHGLLGTRGTRGATPCVDEDEAKRQLEHKIQEKLASDYRRT